MKRTVKRTLALLLAGAALFACNALSVSAAWDFTPSGSAVVRVASPLVVTGGIEGVDYTYQDGVLTILDGGLTVSNRSTTATTSDSIVIGAACTGTLTLNGVRLKTTGAALSLQPGSNVTLTLSGKNTLQSGSGFAGLQVPEGAALTLNGSGSLSAKGGTGAAGIGGAVGDTVGSITLLGGRITAKGGTGAADVGAGQNGTGTGTFVADGNAVLTADTLSDTSAQADWRGIFVTAKGATVYGAITLTDALTLDTVSTVTVDADAHLTVAGPLTVKLLDNRGNVTVQNGAVLTADALSNDGTLTNSGTLSVGAGMSYNGGTLNNAGTLTLAGSTLSNVGALANNGVFGASSAALTNEGTLANTGTLNLAASTLTNNNTLSNGKGATLYARESTLTNTGHGSLENEGTLELDGTALTHEPGALFDPTGTLILGHDGSLTGPAAQDVATEYRIYFDAGKGTVTPASAVTKDGKLETLPTPTYTGYTFDGWFTDAEKGTQVLPETVYTGSLTLYAHWHQTPTATPTATPKPTQAPTPAPTAAPTPSPTPKPTPLEMHKLHFNTMGGLPLDDVTFGLGAPVELWPYTPVRAGYLFAGWYADEALTKPVSTIVLVKDTTIYAKWNVDPAAAAAQSSSSGSGSKGSGSKGGSTAKATPTPSPTATPTPTPTVAPTPAATDAPIPTIPPKEDDQEGSFPVVPVAAGGVALLAAAVLIAVLIRKRMDDSSHHYHHR